MSQSAAKALEDKVLVLQHHPAEGLGRLAPWLASEGLVPEMCLWPDVLPSGDYSALVILGGPMNIVDGTPRLMAEVALAKTFIAAGKPVLGICLGAQVIASALGAAVPELAEYEQGWCALSLADGDLLQVPQWHRMTFDLPEGARLLASSEVCSNQMFGFDKHVLAFQFHPEWDNTSIESLQQAFGERCPIEIADESVQSRLRDWLYSELDAWWASATA
ncbi:type 1 glutamine amidotransferase [Paraferrimonas sedimenticola]|uniref:GMP synthase n=1 Tax=Paraferrimonas sedimenticola TaxID=375674 RepID=A0AA37RSJ9_9GAMM|nr:type 1 glutamine amidotransferase [Paraferrimonas sedimenticola]GLP95175.1 GMP synthase [Paraferrimonas sedimenticola]